jgi:hypothetical protein
MHNMDIAFEIMGMGMGGIFITIGIIMVCVWIMAKLGKKK